jgi:DNA-directed RNA polymerase subunit L
MKINILKENRREIELEIEGETFSVASLLDDYLSKQDGASSSYKVEHYLIPNSKIFVKTEDETPRKALRKAINAIMNDLEQLEESIKLSEE